MSDPDPTASEVLLVVGDASETLDTLVPYYRLIEGGFRPVVVAPEARSYPMVMHEVRPGWTITREWEGDTIEAERADRPRALAGRLDPPAGRSSSLGGRASGMTTERIAK